MAEIYRRTGKFDKALESLKKAESEVQDSLEVPYNMAVVYQAQGKYEEAVTTLQSLLKKTEKADRKYTPGEEQSRRLLRASRRRLSRQKQNRARRRNVPSHARSRRRQRQSGLSADHRHL